MKRENYVNEKGRTIHCQSKHKNLHFILEVLDINLMSLKQACPYQEKIICIQ
jgi:hypothetical protein